MSEVDEQINDDDGSSDNDLDTLDSNSPRDNNKVLILISKLAAGFVGGIVMLIVGMYVQGRWGDEIEDWSKPDREEIKEPFIAVLGPREAHDPGYPLWSDVLRGVKHAEESLPRLSGIRIEKIDDHGDPAEARRQAALLNRQGMLIAVVASATSDVAVEVIDELNDDIPIILPVATNPELTNKGNENLYRLPPSDVSQIDTLYGLVTDQFPGHSVMLMRDHQNAKYSAYIADHLRAKLDKCEDNCDNLNEIIVDGEIGHPGNGIQITDTMEQLGSNLMVFVGLRDTALTALRQTRSFKDWDVQMIFSDGVVDRDFLRLAKEKGEGIYATFPLGPTCNSQLSDLVPQEWLNQPTYSVYGFDAMYLIAKAPTLDRVGVYNYLNRAKTNRGGVEAAGATYEFDKNGNSRDTTFHIWRATNGRWEHDSACYAANDGTTLGQ